ncbi:DUF6138 family protein [Achromobacter sp. MFA1 R4]|uniref:DUF6138 family protein n=1 Tax=Achromobacter sp. MFA1 R4 TaxID=1881016 RepID=UPI0009539B1B|nr:DUF6138 family protein [Achromobacter sp. MFA1 R4]SIT25638.1 hypothetical protein SAMN05428937_3070 [Achromobacter sp. MFA1 R4]
MSSDVSRAIGVHHKTARQIQDEALAAIHGWFDKLQARDDVDAIVARTPLQAGIHSEILLEYEPTRIVFDVMPGWEPDDEDGLHAEGGGGPLSPEAVQESLAPVLREAVLERIARLAGKPHLNHHFRFRAQFPTTGGRLRLTLVDHTDAHKQQWLRERVAQYIDQAVLNGSQPTDPLHVSLLCGHLLDARLFPEPDYARLVCIFQRLLALNAGQPSLAELRGSLIHALRRWSEQQYLPRYVDVSQDPFRQNIYARKPGAALDPQDRGIDLLLYAATLILRHEPGYARPTGLGFLEIARDLGSARAAAMLAEGSGAHPAECTRLTDELVDCAANDVLATVTIAIRQETPAAYVRSLEFITRLLRAGFPAGYRIAFKSTARHYLPVKGLARSDMHRFFANAAQHPQAHDALQAYACAAIQPYEWYTDAEAEKACLSGTYAAFALGLADASRFALLRHYMDQVDDEHQSVQDRYTAVFLEHHGLTPDTVSTAVACLRRCTDGFKLPARFAVDDAQTLTLLADALADLPEHERAHVRAHVRARLFGSDKKLAALARKADDARKAPLLRLLEP